jgi:trypsin
MENENQQIIYIVLGVVVVLGIVLFLSRGTSSTPTPPAPTPPGPTPPGPTPPGPTPVPPEDYSVCGISRPNILPPYIIGGTEVNPKTDSAKYPWMTFVLFPASYCGGSLINANWVLTAAHCLVTKTPKDTTCIFGSSFGDATINAQRITAQSFAIHPDFDIKLFQQSGGDKSVGDIALIRLSRPVRLAKNVSPICLPSKKYDFSNATLIAAGWGRTVSLDESSASEVLREITTKTGKCIPETFGVDKKICTFNPTGGVGGGPASSCRGDSGTPLMLVDNGKFVAVGVTSYGKVACELYPSVYTDVFTYRDFINQTIAKNP